MKESLILRRRIIFFAIPIISGLFVQQLYSVVDMAIIGNFIGANQLAAVGNAANIVILFLVVSGGFEMAVEIIVARLIGKQENWAAKAVNIIFIGGLAGIGMAVLGYYIFPFALNWINLPKHLMQYALIYGRIYLIGLPFIYIYDIARAVLIANEKTKQSFYLLLGSSGLNLILNLFFIIICHLSVAGSALGTVLAQALVMMYTLKLLKGYLNKTEVKLNLEKGELFEIMRIALPYIFQQFAITFAITLVQAWINPFGNEIIIGYVAISKVMELARIVLIGFAQTLTILGAQMLTAKKIKAIQATYKWCAVYSLGYVGIMAILSVLIAPMIAGVFFDVAEHQPAFLFFKTYLVAFNVIQLVSIFKFLNEGLLRSMVHMKEYLYCNIGELIVKVMGIYILLQPLATNAFWSAELLARILMLGLSYYYIFKFAKTDLKVTNK